MIQAILSAIGRFFLRLAGQSEQNADLPLQTNYWQALIGTRNVISAQVSNQIREALAKRVPSGRDHANDDHLFAPLADATVFAISQKEYGLAITMFYDCYQLARDYEHNNGVEVHKGAMTFNVAIAFLRSHDFSAAMHYFELSKYETEQSYGHANWNVFTFNLFDRSYWKLIGLFEQEQPLDLYQDFWNTAYGTASAKADWNAISENSKLLYIVVGAERIRYTRLKSQPNWNGADSIGLSYWNLIADLVRLLETEVQEMGIVGRGLNDMVLNRINSPLPNFRASVTAFRNAHSIHSPIDFNTHFAALRTVIEDPAEPVERRIACAAYLAGSARNQVQHQVDVGMVIFTDRSAAVFTANTFLVLCRLRDWVA